MNQVTTPSGPFIDLLNRFPLEQLEEELERVKGQIAQLDTAARLLDLAIQARLAANGNAAFRALVEADPPFGEPAQTAHRPKLKNAILGVMREHADETWSPTELHKTLRDRGWAPTGPAARSQISNRLGELVKSGQVTKPDKGQYKLVT